MYSVPKKPTESFNKQLSKLVSPKGGLAGPDRVEKFLSLMQQTTVRTCAMWPRASIFLTASLCLCLCSQTADGQITLISVLTGTPEAATLRTFLDRGGLNALETLLAQAVKETRLSVLRIGLKVLSLASFRSLSPLFPRLSLCYFSYGLLLPHRPCSSCQ